MCVCVCEERTLRAASQPASQPASSEEEEAEEEEEEEEEVLKYEQHDATVHEVNK